MWIFHLWTLERFHQWWVGSLLKADHIDYLNLKTELHFSHPSFMLYDYF